MLKVISVMYFLVSSESVGRSHCAINYLSTVHTVQIPPIASIVFTVFTIGMG